MPTIVTKRSGFSLIEMVIALAILAAATTIAIRATSGLQDQARYQATARSLNNIQDAIIGPPSARGPNGSAIVSGFVADIGRLPQFATSSADPLFLSGTADPLSELTLNPNGIPAFAYYSSNIDPTVSIGVGWQGPYLRLGAGPTFVRDGWGNSFRCYDSTGMQISQAGPGLVGPPTQIAQIASGTGSGQPPVSIPNATVSNPGSFAYKAQVAGQVIMNIGTDTVGGSALQTGPTANATFSGIPAYPSGAAAVTNAGVSIWVDYIGPDFTQSGNPVVDIPVLVGNATSSTLGAPWTGTYTGNFLISGIVSVGTSTVGPPTIGPRILKVYVLPYTVTTPSAFLSYVRSATVSNPIYLTSTLNVTLVGGSQTINLALPHYSP